MKRWSASTLKAKYPRCVAGFNWRSWPQPLPPINIQGANKTDRGRSIASIDNEVWSRSLNQTDLTEENGLNLFEGPLDKIIKSQVMEGSVLAGFDLPVALVETLASTFGVVPLSIEHLAGNPDWQLLGYDIVDVRTQSSGFHSFDWSDAELAVIFDDLSVTLNKYGLIDDELLGIKAATSFDLLIEPHAPFAPCGVWVNRSL